jgi:serine protease Do
MKWKGLASALVLGGVVIAGVDHALSRMPVDMPSLPPASVATSAPSAAPDYRAIVRQYGPAVVGIDTQGSVKLDSKDLPPELADDPLLQYFRGPPGSRNPAPEVPVHGLGSGFIVAPDGVILTNAHVVDDASQVTVKLSDRREFNAKVLGSDPAIDVAVLKIDAKNLPAVKLGDAAQLAVGDYVLAIGSPFGFEQSASAGIVSSVRRSLPDEPSVPFIQTDVAVNPGNSGGPLFDAGGNVIGINSQIYSQTGGYQGLSFAIPIDVALNVAKQIAATGSVRHARLGVAVQELSQPLAQALRLARPDGALVSSVAPGSAAARAGLEAGDVVLKYNGQSIARSSDLPALVAMAKPGDRAALEVWRGGKSIQLSAGLTEAKDTTVAAADAGPGAPQDRLGVAVRGAAARVGIQRGDVIVSVNGTPLKSAEQLHDLAAKSGIPLALLVKRGDSQIFVPVMRG